jgi:hypothetical protein
MSYQAKQYGKTNGEVREGANPKGFDFSSVSANNNYSSKIVMRLASDSTLALFSRQVDAETTVTAASVPMEAGIDVPFKKATIAQGGADVPESYLPQIDAIAKEINEKFGGKSIANFKLVSSASPDYGKIGKGPGWEKNYTSTSGTTDPGNGTDDATANQKLAYQRGVNFMDALNSSLKKAGHPGFNSYEVNWQISNTGGPNDNGIFVDLKLAENAAQPKIETKTTVSGEQTDAGSKTDGSEIATLLGYALLI